MIKGIEYTEAMDQAIKTFQKTNLMTIDEVMKKAKLAGSSLYKFRQRKKISINSLKKLKENLGLDLVSLETETPTPLPVQ